MAEPRTRRSTEVPKPDDGGDEDEGGADEPAEPDPNYTGPDTLAAEHETDDEA
jgi:hypothetical protein